VLQYAHTLITSGTALEEYTSLVAIFKVWMLKLGEMSLTIAKSKGVSNARSDF
jgi:hypothetical protein